MLQRGRGAAQACYTQTESRSGGMVDAPVSKTGGIISRVSSSLTFGTNLANHPRFVRGFLMPTVPVTDFGAFLGLCTRSGSMGR